MTAFLPLPAIPFVLLTWIILNITASISPFEVNPAFYKWGYTLPANEAYTVLTDIWSSGSVPQLYRSLPILFSWWVAGLSAATYGHFYRCHKAWTQEQKIEELEKSSDPHAVDNRHTQDESAEPNWLHLTPSQQLLEAAALYRDTYGPSVPMPFHVERLFGLVDEEGNTSQTSDQQRGQNDQGEQEGQAQSGDLKDEDS